MSKDPRFPTFLYIAGGPYFGPPGTTYDVSPPVNSDEELEAALEAGYSLTLPQAVGLEAAPPKPSELRAAAEKVAAEEKAKFDAAVEAAAAKKVEAAKADKAKDKKADDKKPEA